MRAAATAGAADDETFSNSIASTTCEVCLHRSLAFRRSPHLVTFWQNDKLVVCNYASGIAVEATPFIVELLDELAGWKAWKDLAAIRPPEEHRLLRRLLNVMVARSFVARSTQPAAPIETRLSRWEDWNPAAGFFHLATKNVPFRSADDRIAASCKRAQTRPLPAALKSTGHYTVRLPKGEIGGELPSVLLARRTWRRFGQHKVALADLATLLQLTWGVHGWIEVPRLGKFAMKTSPSGGARHSIEVYVDARKVAGLPPGLYHYNPDTHRLAPLGRSSARRVSDYLPGQTWYDDAGALLLMTTVFERVQWRYPYARAYRAILAEAGHLCQTFCLAATWLGLAPFCTMAFADSRIERDLKIDGVSESVIYAAGVGTRPDGVTWAPWPGTDETPALRRPSHAQNGSRPSRSGSRA